MTNQNELTLRQIKTMFKKLETETSEPISQTTGEILLLLENEQAKIMIYKLYDACKTRRKLKAEIKRRELKSSRKEAENTRLSVQINANHRC